MATDDIWEVDHLSDFLERESPTEEVRRNRTIQNHYTNLYINDID